MKKRKKKIVGTVQRGVYVSAATKKQFKKNIEEYRSEGIRSAYALQNRKDIAKRAKLRANVGITRAELAIIKEAFAASKKFQEIGYSLIDLKNFFKKIKKTAKAIEREIKRGNLPYNTAKPYLPVYNNVINVDRLAKMLVSTKKPVSLRVEDAYSSFDHNINALFSPADANELIRLAHMVPAGRLYREFENEANMNVLVIYDYETFDIDDRPDVEERRDDIFRGIGSDTSFEYIYDILVEILRDLGKDW